MSGAHGAVQSRSSHRIGSIRAVRGDGGAGDRGCVLAAEEDDDHSDRLRRHRLGHALGGKDARLAGVSTRGGSTAFTLMPGTLQLVGHHLSERTTAPSLPRTLLPAPSNTAAATFTIEPRPATFILRPAAWQAHQIAPRWLSRENR